MGPQQHQLHNDEPAGIHHILAAQRSLQQRDDQRRRVGINHSTPLNHIQFQRLFQQCRQRQKQQVHDARHHKRIRNAGAHLRRVVDLERVQDHARHDQIHHDDRQHPAVLRLQQPDPDHQIPHQQNQKQLRDFFRQQDTDRHTFTPLISPAILPQFAAPRKRHKKRGKASVLSFNVIRFRSRVLRHPAPHKAPALRHKSRSHACRAALRGTSRGRHP